MDLLEVAGHGQRLVHAHRHQLRQTQRKVRFSLNGTPNRAGFGRIPGSAAIRAFDGNVRQELHVERDRTGAVARRATQSAGVVREIASLPAARLGVVRAGEGAAQFVVNIGISGHGGAHVRADRRGIDEIRTTDALGLKLAHVFRQQLPRRLRFECGNQRFEYHRGFAGAGDSGHRHEPAARDINVQRLDCMQLTGCHADAAKAEHLRFGHTLTYTRTHLVG